MSQWRWLHECTLKSRTTISDTNIQKKNFVLTIQIILWNANMVYTAPLLTVKKKFRFNSFITSIMMKISICSIIKLSFAPSILLNTTKPYVYMLIICKTTEEIHRHITISLLLVSIGSSRTIFTSMIRAVRMG